MTGLQDYVDPPWFLDTGRANCADTPPELFFQENTHAAKAICADCPLRQPCLQYALDNNQQGVWGGTSETERRRLRTGPALAGLRRNRDEQIRAALAHGRTAAAIAETYGVTERTVNRVAEQR